MWVYSVVIRNNTINMSKKMNSLMEQVAQVATERKELEVKESALKAALLDEMRSAGLSKDRVR
jgi:hypothetical protein